MKPQQLIYLLLIALTSLTQGQEETISGDFGIPDPKHSKLTAVLPDGTRVFDNGAVKYHPKTDTLEWTVAGRTFLQTGDYGKVISFPSERQDADPRKYQPNPPDKNDCLIVATETYARLKNTGYWARIAGFDYSTNERNAPGHAVVLFQPTRESTVWLYDKAGSRDLGIKSHDLSELKEAISGWLKGNGRVSDIRWIGEENGDSHTKK